MAISGESPEKPGYSYVIEALSITDLGSYTCQAYNGVGQAVSSTTELRVMGPIDTSGLSREEQNFLRYVVDAPRSPYPTYGQPERPRQPETPRPPDGPRQPEEPSR